MKVVTLIMSISVMVAHPGFCQDSTSEQDRRPSAEVLWISETTECPIKDLPPPWGSEDREPFTYKAGGDITEATLKSKRPLDAEKCRDRTGTVQVMPVMELVIGRTGSVDAILLIRGEKNCWLDELTKYYRTWKFEPATKDGVPVCVTYIVTIRVGLQ